MAILAAFILPHPPLIVLDIGKGKQNKIQNTIDAYQRVAREIAQLRPDTIVVTSPHSILYADYIHISPGLSASGNFARFGAPDVNFTKEYDTEFATNLQEAAAHQKIPAGFFGERSKALDHGVLVPLYFVEQCYKDYQLVRCSISGLGPLYHYNFGKCIADAAQDTNKRVVLIASGDLSHKLTADGPYGYAKEGPEFDKCVTQAMTHGDFASLMTFENGFCEAAAECGLRSFIIMAGALDKKSVKPELYSYEGPFGVGYAVASFFVTGDDENRAFDKQYLALKSQNKKDSTPDRFIALARQSLEHFIKTGSKLQLPNDLPGEMLDHKAGVFVSLKIDGALRGCIGTIAPVTNSVAQEVINNAISAGTQDPRFMPIGESELSQLVYSVDVLGHPEAIQSMDELDVKRYGVIVTKGIKRGLLLPNLEGIDTPQKQVEIALQKAGISPRENYQMERFEVVRHE